MSHTPKPSWKETLWSWYESFELLPIKVLRHTVRVYARLTGWKFVAALGLFHVGLIFALEYAIVRSRLALDDIIAPVIKNFYGIDKIIEEDKEAQSTAQFDQFIDGFKTLLMPIMKIISLSLLQSAVDSFTSLFLSNRIQNETERQIFKEQVILSASKDPKIREQLPLIISDTSAMCTNYSRLASSAATAVVTGSLSIHAVVSYSRPLHPLFPAPDLLVYTLGGNIFMQGLFYVMSGKSAKYQQQASNEHVLKSNHFHSAVHQGKAASQQKAENSMHIKHRNWQQRIVRLSAKGMALDISQSSLQYLQTRALGLFYFYLIAHKLYDASIPLAEQEASFTHLHQVGSSVAWFRQNSTTVKSLEHVTGRVENFLDHVERVENHHPNFFWQEQSLTSGDMMRVKDLTLKAGERTLFEHQNLSFQMSERILITGRSGEGKSSLLSKMMGLVHDGIDAEGQILVQKGAFVKMMAQEDFWPDSEKLLDIVSLPYRLEGRARTEFRNALKNNMKLVGLAEGRITDFLHEECDDGEIFPWNNKLSGGEKKKAMLAGILTLEPQILILDEAFNGLDAESVKWIQDMLKTHLPDATIISIDHHGLDHHRLSDFYKTHYELKHGEFTPKWLRPPSTYVKDPAETSLATRTRSNSF